MALPLSYNWRNVLVRKFSSGLTFLVVSVVVAVLALLLSFAEGINTSLMLTGNPSNIIVLRTGATAESTSLINADEANRAVQAPGVATDPAGRPMVSHELCAQTNLPRNDGRGIANVGVRGVDDIAFAVHSEVKLVEGRIFAPGALEVIVGTAARNRYHGLSIDGVVPMGRSANRDYAVVGVFEAGGGALENEIWGARPSIMDSFRRTFISSSVVRVRNPSAVAAAIAYLEGPVVRLQAKRETDYYSDLTSKTRDIVILTSILITIMGIGAAFAVANTMYAAVDGRKREIAMLRTIGFKRSAIVTAFIIESLLICLAACLIGLLASGVITSLMSAQDFLSDTTWTVLAYELKLTPKTIVISFLLCLLVGGVGGLAPALRASRTRIIEALRKA